MKLKISVLMPVLNGAKYLEEALKSILNQTYKNFELIVIDDGSIDDTLIILSKIKDKRLRIISKGRHLGLSKALNIGIAVSKGKYIARCDADDINFPERFKKQVNFLKKNPEYVLVGSNALAIGKRGKILKKILMPETDTKIRKSIIFRNNIIHPSVMMVAKAVRKVGGYSNMFNLGAEEYDLWFRLISIGKMHNLQEILIKKRFHNKVYTNTHHLRVEIFALLARLKYLRKYLEFWLKK